MNGKGSSPRPYGVSRRVFEDNWVKAFRRGPKGAAKREPEEELEDAWEADDEEDFEEDEGWLGDED